MADADAASSSAVDAAEAASASPGVGAGSETAAATSAETAGTPGGKPAPEGISVSDLDRQIAALRRCEYLKESEVKAICAKAREILIDESNVQRVDAPVTVSSPGSVPPLEV